jgi:uncharacterized membrane protein
MTSMRRAMPAMPSCAQTPVTEMRGAWGGANSALVGAPAITAAKKRLCGQNPTTDYGEGSIIMAFCNKCGTQVQDGTKFCPSCGATVEGNFAQAQPGQTGQQQQTQTYGYTPPVVPGAPSQTDIGEAQSGKTMSILAYILFFIPLLAGEHKKNGFVKYHTNQGTVLFLFCVAWGILYGILTAILTALLFSPATWYTGVGFGAWGIITTILGLLWLIPAILCVVGIVHAVKVEMKPLPLIGRFRIIK